MTSRIDWEVRLVAAHTFPTTMKTHQSSRADTANSPHHTAHYPLPPLRRNPWQSLRHVQEASKMDVLGERKPRCTG